MFYIKYPLVFLLSFFCSFINSQIKENIYIDFEISSKKFTSQNGYKIFKTKSLVFDDLGWLWLSGSNLELVDEEIDSRAAIIQRFDGNRFYTIELPLFSDKKPLEIELTKRQDGQFYVTFNRGKEQSLYLLNPETLVFKKIILPISITSNPVILFPFKDYVLVLLSDNYETNIFKLNENLQFSLFSKMPIEYKEKKLTPFFSNFIEFNNHFLVSDQRSGMYMFTEDGKLLKKVTFKDLDITNETENNDLTINRWFKRNNKVIIYFNEIPQVYEYNQYEKQFILLKKPLIAKKNKFENKWIFGDGKENLVEQIPNKNGSNFSLYYKDFHLKEAIAVSGKDFYQVVSRDLFKELFFANNGEFYQYTFQKPIVTTFFENESIRNMLQINDDEVLVSNERRGLYLLNLKEKTTEKNQFNFQNKNVVEFQGRAIFEDENYYWSNSNKGVVWIDKKTNTINEEVYYPPATLIEDDNYIYYGTHNFDLLQFDKKTKKSTVVTETKDYDVQGLLKIDNTFYLATAQGLVVFKDEKKQLYTVSEKGNDNFFLSIVNHPKYGILLGSHSGKLYQFNTDKNNFTLLYNDELKASIATILFDDKNQIWLNTFNGIVSLDLDYKFSSRFTMNDGLSFYEANRYSALKTKDGHFLVGTLRGLNYFHPDEISKQEINATLKLTSTSYYDKELNKQIEEHAPTYLNNLTTIELSPESKNLYFQFSLFGMYNSEKIKYRYKLNEDNWVDLENKPEVRLSNLSAGDYTLKVEAIDTVNNRIGNPIILAIAIDDFFYNKIWFYLLIILVTCSIAFWYVLEQQKTYRIKEEFATKIINTQEQERLRVAKELHDSIGQRLLIFKKTVTQKEKLNKEELKMISETIQEVRSISHNLHPFQFEKIGLTASLKNMLNEFQKSSEIFYSYDIDDISGLLPREKELFVFRMLQECIVNVEKHAQSKACNLKVTNSERDVTFQIKDNGKGFDEDKPKNKNGIGLKNLQERASYINADFDIKSEKNKGTIITIKIRK